MTPALLTITAFSTTKTYGQTLAFTTTEFTASGLVGGDTVTGVTLTSAGAIASAPVASSLYAITPGAAEGAGLSNYTIAYVNGSLTVTPAALTVTAIDTSKVYGAAVPGLTFAVSGLANGDTNAIFAGALATAANTSSPVVAGGYAITQGSLAAGSNYTIIFTPGTLTVTPAPLTITPSGMQVFGGSPTFSAIYGGFVLGEDPRALAGTLSFTTTTSSNSSAGTYAGAVTASGQTSTNYAITYDSGPMNVTPAASAPVTDVSATSTTIELAVGSTSPGTSVLVQYSTDPNLPPLFTTLAGTSGQTGSSDGNGPPALFDAPQGVAVDASGNIYVADTGNDTIREIAPSDVVTTIAGVAGVAGSSDGPGASALFDAPEGVAVDVHGDVFVADTGNDTIRELTPVGGTWTVTTFAGIAGQAGSRDGTTALFDAPADVAVDAGGNVYVADTGNDTIRLISSTGVTTLAGTADQAGSADGTGASARLDAPSAVAVDGGGNIYVADFGNNAIRKITPDRLVSTLPGTFNDPSGVAVDSQGDVYVASVAAGTIDEITPGGVITFPLDPSGIALDGSGNVIAANTGANSIERLNLSVPSVLVSPGDGTASVTLPGLNPDTTYYFRALITSADGTAVGGIQQFTTRKAMVVPTITWTNPVDITYGTPLSNTQLDASASVGGAFAYTPAAGTILDAGQNQTLVTTFTPTDTTDDATNTASVTINVDRATSSFNTLAAPTITYGADTDTISGQVASNAANGAVPTGQVRITLGNVTQMAVIQADGRFSSNFATAGLGAGSYTVSYAYTATLDFTAATDSASLTVNKATPTIDWSNPADITYGTALSSTQLDASASIAGGLVYTSAMGTVLNAGQHQSISVVFTPADTRDYSAATASVTINVAKAGLTITASSPSKVYGAALPALAASYSGFVNGDTSASLTTQPALATTTTASSAVASYPTSASGRGRPELHNQLCRRFTDRHPRNIDDHGEECFKDLRRDSDARRLGIHDQRSSQQRRGEQRNGDQRRRSGNGVRGRLLHRPHRGDGHRPW